MLSALATVAVAGVVLTLLAGPCLPTAGSETGAAVLVALVGSGDGVGVRIEIGSRWQRILNVTPAARPSRSGPDWRWQG